MKSRECMALAAMMAVLVPSNAVVAGPFDGIHPLQSDRFSASLGAFFSDVDDTARLGNSGGNDGTEVDLHDLGVDDSQTLPAFELTWRVSNNSRILGEYLTIAKDGKVSIAHRIEWGDVGFDIGANVETDMGFDIVRVFYGYSFLKDEKKELGAGFGLHFAELDIALQGNGTINGIPVFGAEASLDERGLVPNLGAYGNYALSPKWLLIGWVDWFSASIGGYSGELWNAGAEIQYQAFRHAGVGLAYRYLKFDLEADKSRGDWRAGLEYTGPELYLSVNF